MNVLENVTKPKVKLLGKDGNAFVILGACQIAMRKAGWTRDQISAFIEEATAGDYNNVLCTAMKYCDVC